MEVEKWIQLEPGVQTATDRVAQMEGTQVGTTTAASDTSQAHQQPATLDTVWKEVETQEEETSME